MAVELTESLFATIAGWDAVKRARALLRMDAVSSSDWSPPLLKGVVREGSTSYRAGLVIKDHVDVENLCSCTQSRASGIICAHSVAIGLHNLKAAAPAAVKAIPTQVEKPRRGLRRATGEEQGTRADIFVIFPPALKQAIARDKIMLCFEAESNGRRLPLSALPKTESYRFQPKDEKLLNHLEEVADGETPSTLMFRAQQLAALLPLLIGHTRLTVAKKTAIEVSAKPWIPMLDIRLESSGEIEIKAMDELNVGCTIAGSWILAGSILQPVGLTGFSGNALKGAVRLRRSQVPQFVSQELPRLLASGNVKANFESEDFQIAQCAPEFLFEMKGGLAQLDGKLILSYAGVKVAPDSPELWLPDAASPTRYFMRDPEAERSAAMRLPRVGFHGPDADGNYRMEGQNQVLNFFARELPKLQRQWKVSMGERLQQSTCRNLERIEPRFEITASGVQWFDFDVSFASSSGEKLSATDIQRLLLSGQSHTRLKNGKLAIIDTGAVEELQETLLDCSPQQHAAGYRIGTPQAGFLEATLRAHGWQAKTPATWREQALPASPDAAPGLQCPPLGELETVLRPYQKAGVAWLRFLRGNDFGGILADEMGLGKTLQVLALLNWLRETGERRPALVVCPTSLVWNWAAEAARFTPGVKVLALHGPDRHSRFPAINENDLVITSYALIRRDAEHYRTLEFDTVVLDEAQHIKNRDTQNAQAVKAIKASHRLVLTGTPLENSVLDLWSIFDFLMPGYLGSAQDFRERYEFPITRDQSEKAQTRLARRLRPFILRRTKREVAPDLPAKIEQIAYCELSDDQAAIYGEVLNASRREVLDAVGAQGLARSRMVVLNALLRLRQVCCDIRLLKLDGAAPESPSGKMALFRELLDEVIDGGHRVLVFSQFVSMLTLLREELERDSIGYAYLDGSTTNRGEVVASFQTNGAVPVFLISLKAGGVGLNLTGADTVIHFDPWWNPAVEDQATDRAHRIGQAKVVTSYKLIARNTVEEKILTLQARKREVISATLGDEQQLAEALTWEEIQELLTT